jgi:hypothetical protein
MKKIYIVALIAGILICFSMPSKAQTQINLSVNISSQPIWGPVGYDEVLYYYLPDIDVYYYVPKHRFIYLDRGRWIYSSNLPPRYRNYDLYKGYKVVINEHRPYLHDKEYMEKYSSYKNRHDQQPIRDSRDSKYFVIKDHPEHNNWVKQQKENNAQINKQPSNNRMVQDQRKPNANKKFNNQKQNNSNDHGKKNIQSKNDNQKNRTKNENR